MKKAFSDYKTPIMQNTKLIKTKQNKNPKNKNIGI
jgi:hypothetical protein